MNYFRPTTLGIRTNPVLPILSTLLIFLNLFLLFKTEISDGLGDNCHDSKLSDCLLPLGRLGPKPFTSNFLIFSPYLYFLTRLSRPYLNSKNLKKFAIYKFKFFYVQNGRRIRSSRSILLIIILRLRLRLRHRLELALFEHPEEPIEPSFDAVQPIQHLVLEAGRRTGDRAFRSGFLRLLLRCVRATHLRRVALLAGGTFRRPLNTSLVAAPPALGTLRRKLLSDRNLLGNVSAEKIKNDQVAHRTRFSSPLLRPFRAADDRSLRVGFFHQLRRLNKLARFGDESR